MSISHAELADFGYLGAAPRAQSHAPGADGLSRPVPGHAGYELTVVVPTYNERDNIRSILDALEHALSGIAWEVIFVDDDSPDGTAGYVRAVARKLSNVRCLQRIGRRGLSSACVEGMLASAAPFLAVMDADLQHDPGIIPLMLRTLQRDRLDVVVGSRYVDGGGIGDWNRSRLRLSGLGTRLAKLAIRASLKDPMSGFFVLRREFLERTVRRLSGTGFKILVDLFMSDDHPPRFAEVAYSFGTRRHGTSKLDFYIAWQFLSLLADKLLGHLVPLRFVMFVVVGVAGASMHLTVLGLLTQLFGYSLIVGQSAATVVAMTVNFFLNNLLTYRDRKLRGWKLVCGLISFYLACGLGAMINVVLADVLFDRGLVWWLAGLIGALVGAVWNFAITSSFTWRRSVRPSGNARDLTFA